MSFLLRKPCKTDRTCSITVSPAEGSSEWMRNWGRCFSMALGAGAVSGPYVSWPCLLGISFRGQFAAVLFPAAWQETAYVMLSRGSESCSGILLLTVSCWSPQQVVVLVCSVSNKHHHFPLCLSRWELVAHFIVLETSLLSQAGTYSTEMDLAGVGRHSTLLRAVAPFSEGCTLLFAFSLPGSDARRRVRGAGRWVWGVFTGLQPHRHAPGV